MDEKREEQFLKALELQTLAIHYVERETQKGERQIVLHMEQMRAEGGSLHTQQMTCDLGRLEEVVRRGTAFEEAMGSGHKQPHWESPDRVERFSNYEVSYFATTDVNGIGRIDVHTNQSVVRPGQEVESQDIWCSLDSLKEVVRVGLDVEKERGIERNYYVVIGRFSLVEAGVARCYVENCYTKEDDAQIAAHKMSNPASKPQAFVSWPTSHKWELRRGDELLVKAGVDSHVDDHIRVLEFNRERQGVSHTFGVWRELGRTPVVGMPIDWNMESRGIDSTGKPVDYQVSPAVGRKEAGIPEQTFYVVFDIRERKISDIFSNRDEAVEAIKDWNRFEKSRQNAIELQKSLELQHKNEQTLVETDLSKHTFRPRR